MVRPKYMLLSVDAREFASELDIKPTAVCQSAKDAISSRQDCEIILGDPDLISEVLPSMSNVRWVQSTWAGVKPLIDLDRRDYVLTNVKDVFGVQMAEYVVGHLLAFELKIVERIEQQADHSWFDAHSSTLSGKRIGIMGTGSIGQDIARYANMLGMSPVGLNRSGTLVEHFVDVFAIANLHDFLRSVDHLVSVLPQTPATDNLLDRKALAGLKPGSLFVNVGRGNVVDDDVLVEALKTDRLAGAVLDVFREEPLPESHAFWETPNLRMTAHTAAVSHPSLIVPLFEENYRRFVAGEPLNFVVNFDAGY